MIFGVVPLAINVWKPLIAPQAMVIKQKGKIFPGTTGPDPSIKCVSAGMCNFGNTKKIPATSAKIVPNFMNVLK